MAPKGTKTGFEFSHLARDLLREQMHAHGVTVPELAVRLQEVGYPEATASLHVKISRGKFQFAFALICLSAMGVEVASIKLPKRNEIKESKVGPARERPRAMAEMALRKQASRGELRSQTDESVGSETGSSAD